MRVIDGDTLIADLSLWHTITSRETIRVLGVDSPELTGLTKEAGLLAKAFTERWVAQGPFTVNSCKRDSFGRVLGIVFRDGQILADDLIAAGHGVKR